MDLGLTGKVDERNEGEDEDIAHDDLGRDIDGCIREETATVTSTATGRVVGGERI